MPYWAAKAPSPKPATTKSRNIPPSTKRFARKARKQRICIDFVAIFHTLQSASKSRRLLFSSFGETRYPFLRAAIQQLQESQAQFVDTEHSRHGWSIESMHLACLIYIAITFRDALQDDNSSSLMRNSLDELNMLLGRRKRSWMTSRDELLNVMLSSDNR